MVRGADAPGAGAGRPPVRDGPAQRPGLHGAVAGAVVHRRRRAGRPRLGDRAGQPRRRPRGRRHHPLRRPRCSAPRRLRGITHPRAQDDPARPRRRSSPRRALFTAHVVVSRGRLARRRARLRDRPGHPPDHPRVAAPPGSPPPSTNELLGPAQRARAQRTLQLANPGDDVVRAQVKVDHRRHAASRPRASHPVSVPSGLDVQVPLTQGPGQGAQGRRARRLGDGRRTDHRRRCSPARARTGVLTVPADDVTARGRDPAPGRAGQGARKNQRSRPRPLLSGRTPPGCGPRHGVRRRRASSCCAATVACSRATRSPSTLPRGHGVRARRAAGYAGPRRGACSTGDGATVIPLHRAADPGPGARRSRPARTDRPRRAAISRRGCSAGRRPRRRCRAARRPARRRR